MDASGVNTAQNLSARSLSDGHRLLVVAIVFATLLGAWMIRFETLNSDPLVHRNRFTGAICSLDEECWAES